MNNTFGDKWSALLIIAIALVVSVLGGIWGQKMATGPFGPEFRLPELGVSIYPDESLGLTYMTRRTAGIGDVLWFNSNEVAAASTVECYLGVMLMVDKSVFREEGGAAAEEEIRKGTRKQNGMPPTVKEFETFYLVFEPSDTTCSDNPSLERKHRDMLWKSVQTARET